jgi:hypothetical protein
MNRYEIQNKLNQEHFDNPTVGDYWQEMFCPYFIVLEIVDSSWFWICDERKAVDSNHWTWDLENSKIVSKKYFDRVKYDPTNNKFMADVIVRQNCPFSKSWNELKNNLPQYIKYKSEAKPKVEDLLDEIEKLKKDRSKWLNSYVSLLLNTLNETTSSGETYYELITEENPELADKFKKEVAKFLGS